jgi:hypothetical protein
MSFSAGAPTAISLLILNANEKCGEGGLNRVEIVIALALDPARGMAGSMKVRHGDGYTQRLPR